MKSKVIFSLILVQAPIAYSENYCLKRNEIICSGSGHPEFVDKPEDYTNNISVDATFRKGKTAKYKVVFQWVCLPKDMINKYVEWYIDKIDTKQKTGKQRLCIEISGNNYYIHKLK